MAMGFKIRLKGVDVRVGVSNVDVCGRMVGTDICEDGMDKVSLRAMGVGDVGV